MKRKTESQNKCKCTRQFRRQSYAAIIDFHRIAMVVNEMFVLLVFQCDLAAITAPGPDWWWAPDRVRRVPQTAENRPRPVIKNIIIAIDGSYVTYVENYENYVGRWYRMNSRKKISRTTAQKWKKNESYYLKDGFAYGLIYVFLIKMKIFYNLFLKLPMVGTNTKFLL